MRRVGVIAQPEVRSRRLDPADQFVIVASDGVWEYITDDEAVELIAQFPNDATLGVLFMRLLHCVTHAVLALQGVEGWCKLPATDGATKRPITVMTSLCSCFG